MAAISQQTSTLGFLTFGYCSSNPRDKTFTGGLFNSSVATPSWKIQFLSAYKIHIVWRGMSYKYGLSWSYLYVNIDQAWIQTISCSKITEKHISLQGK